MNLIHAFKLSGTDVHILWASVFLRLMSYGLTNQVLTLQLEILGLSPAQIGWFMTLTLLGDTAILYYMTWNADKLGRRRVMLFGAFLMFVSGAIFTTSDHFWLLLLAATIGVISPSGDETGPFKSVEEACIIHLVPHNLRPEILGLYGLLSTAGGALGSIVAGYLVDFLNSKDWQLLLCYRAVFAVYTIIAGIKFVCMCFLSNACELHGRKVNDVADDASLDEQELLVPSHSSGLSERTRFLLPRLLTIFMLDSLGYGFMPAGWIVYYLNKKFSSSPSAIGTLFFVNNSINAVSLIPSAILAKVLGPVRAILFTQVPSALFMASVPLFPSFVGVALALILYYTTSTMDVVPRQIMLASMVPNTELTKVMGVVNIGKTFARCVGPIFTGHLAEISRLDWAFFINGACVLCADIVLGCSFWNYPIDHEV